MSKIEEMSLEYANKQLKDADVTDINCPRELAIAQASMMVNGYKAGANAILKEIENILKADRILGNPFPSQEMRLNAIGNKIKELKGE